MSTTIADSSATRFATAATVTAATVTAATVTAPASITGSATAKRKRVPRLLAGLVAAALALSAGSVGAASLGVTPVDAANAAGGLSVSVVGRPDLQQVADANYLTELQITGSGYQSVVNGFGGMYVLFGWVDGGAWAPSQGGNTGSNYRYVYDDEANPVGYQLFVSFPGSSTEYAANGGELHADGSFSATMKIPGAQFEAYDRSGNISTVNCLEVQCGIITIGAHGVVNANNESFTPLTFTDIYGDDAQAKAAAEAAAAAAAVAAPAAPEVQTPAPTTTTTIVAAPAEPASGSESLLTIVIWAVIGVAVLAVATVAFLVWAVLSGRKRAATAAAAATAVPAASPGASAGSDQGSL